MSIKKEMNVLIVIVSLYKGLLIVCNSIQNRVLSLEMLVKMPIGNSTLVVRLDFLLILHCPLSVEHKNATQSASVH